MSEVLSSSKVTPTLSGYDHKVFDLLADPDAANATLASQNGKEVIESSIRELFIRHGMCDQFGVTLLHRHFDLDQSERLVEVGKTSTPWGPSAYENTFLGKVIPQAFIFSAPGQVVPFEYTFFTHEVISNGAVIDINSATKAFVDDLETLLFSFKLEKVLGLRTRGATSEKCEVEFTVDRANIFIELETPTPNSVVTSWYFCEHHADSTGAPRTTPRCEDKVQWAFIEPVNDMRQFTRWKCDTPPGAGAPLPDYVT